MPRNPRGRAAAAERVCAWKAGADKAASSTAAAASDFHPSLFDEGILLMAFLYHISAFFARERIPRAGSRPAASSRRRTPILAFPAAREIHFFP
jgi:hypothetical protein